MRALLRILRAARHERARALPNFVLGSLWRLLCGRLAAWQAGFPRGQLGPGARVIGSRYIQVGPHASIKRQAWIEAVTQYGAQAFQPHITIGARFLAFDRLHISALGKIQIGDDCLFGSGVYIGDHNHGNYRGVAQSTPDEVPAARMLQVTGPVFIGARVWLGDNVVILGPVHLGDGVVVGANTVVTQDLPAGVMAAGNPLRIIKRFNPQTGVWEVCNPVSP